MNHFPTYTPIGTTLYTQNGHDVTWEVETRQPLPLPIRFYPVVAKELSTQQLEELNQLDQDFIDSLGLF